MLGCGRQGGKNAHVGRVLAGERNTHSMFGLLEFFLRGGIIHNRASGSERAVAKQTPSFPMTIASGFLATCRSRGRDRPNRCKVRWSSRNFGVCGQSIAHYRVCSKCIPVRVAHPAAAMSEASGRRSSLPYCSRWQGPRAWITPMSANAWEEGNGAIFCAGTCFTSPTATAASAIILVLQIEARVKLQVKLQIILQIECKFACEFANNIKYHIADHIADRSQRQPHSLFFFENWQTSSQSDSMHLTLVWE